MIGNYHHCYKYTTSAINLSLLNIMISKLQEKNLINYLNFQLLEHTFFFHVNYYDQIDRVAMGSPLGPVLADLVMCFYEKRWLVRSVSVLWCFTFSPSCQWYYLFVWFWPRCWWILKILNSHYPSIKFPFEKQIMTK